MFKTKLEVDKHVDNSLKKINNEFERNIRSYAFAKLYYQVGAYEQAHCYLTSYLNAKPNSAEGYHLLGKCLEKLGKLEGALEAYRNSLHYDSKQNHLIIKVCELLASNEVSFDKAAAKYYCELAQQIDPNNSFVTALKDRLILTFSNDDNGGDPNQVTNLLLREMETRPTDIKLRIKLIQHLVDNKYIKQAYQHACAIETKNLDIFYSSIDWYETFANVLLLYQRELVGKCDENFYLMAIEVLDRLVALSMDIKYNDGSMNIKNATTDYVSNLFNLDQMLQTASDKLAKNSMENRHFLVQYQAQLYLHLSTLVFKLYRKQMINQKEALNLSIPLLMGAYIEPPEQHLETINGDKMKRLQILAAFRCSQAGHMLLQLSKTTNVIDKGHQLTTGNWRENIFRKLFPKRDQLNKMSSSYFINSTEENVIVIKLPSLEDLYVFDQKAQFYAPNMLHNYIWTCRNYEYLEKFKLSSFEQLRLEIKNVSNCAAETLCQLDLEAFIYCATFCNIQSSVEKVDLIMPANVTDNLATLDQDKFFQSAYKMYSSSKNQEYIMELRLKIVKGIEVVRCVGNHGLDVKLLLWLGDLFSRKSENSTQVSEVEAYANRAELYYKCALPLLEKLKANQPVIYPNQRMFKVRSISLNTSEIIQYIEKVKLFIGIQLMKRNSHEKALELFDLLKDPYSSFYQSQIYRKMANALMETEKERPTNNTTVKEEYIALLTKSRDYLYLTLDRLRDPNIDHNHPLNSQLAESIESIEYQLMDLEETNDNNIENSNLYSTNSNISIIQSTPTKNILKSPQMKYNTLNSIIKPNSSWRKEARPSPERLDAQLRQLVASRDSILNNVLEQNRIMVDSHRCLLEELRAFKDAFNNLTITVDDVKSMKHDLDLLKKSVEELKISNSDTQHVIDVIHEMKREIVELKKDTHSRNQLSEEDLYVFDTEYDYGTGNVANTNLPAANYLHGNTNTATSSRLPSNNLNYGISNANLYAGLYPTMYAPYGTFPELMAPIPPQTFNPTNLLQHSPKVSISSQYPFADNSNNFISNLTSSKSLPVNVVITSSDPLPKATTTIAVQSTLSVTIPPQHLKGSSSSTSSVKPHNYQIPLPSNPVSSGLPAILNDKPPVVSTHTILTNVSPPVFSAVTPQKSTSVTPAKNQIDNNVSLGVEIENSLNKTFTENKSNISTISSDSVEEYDPCPDFKPIIPLPDEVPTNTGEESETVLFCARAKLYRFVSGEWKERGVGNIKILHNPDSGKVRILMRRDQVFKVCANHYVTKDMRLSSMPNNDKAWVWAANDFADESVTLEKLCVRFKTIEEAKQFYDCFESAKSKISTDSDTIKTTSIVTTSSKTDTDSSLQKNISSTVSLQTTSATNTLAINTFGGFVFSSTPTFKLNSGTETTRPVSDSDSFVKNNSLTAKSVPSPFASFTFGSPATSSLTSGNSTTPTFSFSSFTSSSKNNILNASSKTENISPEEEQDDFVPTAEFKPVVELPNIVEVKTGEENAEVLFECRAKLYRYDNTGDEKQWKERGIGIVKVLREETTIRLVMRREQVHKVCLNHQVLKKMDFKQNTPNTILWHAKDFSEGQLIPETFTLKFKNEELATNFLQTVQTAQTSLDENNVVTKKHHKSNNSGNGILTGSSPNSGFGDKFKPAKGSWDCKNCYVVNEAKQNMCIACESPKPGSKVDQDHGLSGSKFSFGGGGTVSNWGNTFKPAVGTWECSTCYVRNSSDKKICISCETPQDGQIKSNKGVEQLTPSKGIDLTVNQKFSFGIPASSADSKDLKLESLTDSTKDIKNISSILNQPTGEQKFSFGIPVSSADSKDTKAKCLTAVTDPSKENKNTSFTLDKSTGGQKFFFGFNNAFSSQSTPLGSTTFKFSMPISNTNTTLTSPAPSKNNVEHLEKLDNSDQKSKGQSPRQTSGHENDESDDSYVEEENDNIYFKPVVPLPDKIEVKTGEEQEDVIYCHRCKLFRFSDGEWKERGIGDIKILKQKTSNRLRVVMRRDQVLKICLNHILTKDIEYRPKDEKTWLFHAADYSDGEICYEKFCVRFKTAEIAQEFKKAVDNAVNEPIDNKIIDITKDTNTNEKDNDIIFVSETIVSKEEEKEAIKLGLPPKFMAYKQLPDCNCDQCKKDDEYFKDFAKENKVTTPVTTNKTNQNETASPLKDLLVKPSIFGNFTKSATTTTKTESEKFVFNSASSPKTIFGSSNFATASNIFGKSEAPSITKASENLFTSDNSGFATTKEKSIFKSGGSSIFGTVSSSGGSIFGNRLPLTPTSSIFGASTTTNATESSIGLSTTQTKTTNLKESDEPILKCASDLSFASLAAKSNTGEAFAQSKNNISPFSFGGTVQPVFSSSVFQNNARNDDSKNEIGENDNSCDQHNEEEYDPHYDPVVPLPDAIVVTTGEENETVIFNERAKLYRFDDSTKEWKERGVGQIKILYHPDNKTYRFLLRREQVHKVVLNQLINNNLELQPMSTSDKAWMWFGYNYYSAEEGEPEKNSLEKLAIRFKNCELARAFYNAVQNVIEQLSQNSSTNKSLTSTDSTLAATPITILEEKNTGPYDAEQVDEVEDEEEEEDDEQSILFRKCGTLYEQVDDSDVWNLVSVADVQINYCPELYGARIIISDENGLVLSNTIIGLNTLMDLKNNECQWRGVEKMEDESYKWRSLKIIFNSDSDAEEFYNTYLEGYNYAQELNIVDEIPEEDDTQDDYEVEEKE